MNISRCSATALAALLAMALPMAQQAPALRAPVPVEPVAAILDAFRTRAVVGLSAENAYGDDRVAAFIMSLIRDPRSPQWVTDVVVEGASGRYQDVTDRWVRGEAVADNVLRHVWDDTTQTQLSGPIWTGEAPPLYRLIRDLNTSLPRDRQLRILLGDPPIDWDTVHTPDDFMKWLEQRDSYPADLIRREVVAKRRRALVLFGGGHLQHRNQVANYQMNLPQAQTIVSLLRASGTETFVIRVAGEPMTPVDGMETWSVPSLALVRGTTLGAADEPQGALPRMMIRDGQILPLPRERWITVRLEDQVDAVLYLGPPSTKTVAPIPRSICSDRAYIETRLKRMALAGLPPAAAERLKQFCGER